MSGSGFARNVPAVAPLQAQAPLQSGRYYFAPNISSPGTSASFGISAERAVPIYVPNLVTLARIGAEVTVVGDAGSKYRLGIRADDGTGRPGALILDAGTIAGDSVAVQEIVIAQQLQPGSYWLTGTVQLVTTTQPTLRSTSNPTVPLDVGTTIPTANRTATDRVQTGVAGALPATWTDGGAGGAFCSRIFIKVQ